jgi:hypothetical protein
MSTPRVGDRVRVTYEGTVGDGGDMFIPDPLKRTWFPLEHAKSVEVLPKPVYANHDTIAWQNGDVVRTELGSALVRQDDCWNGADSGIGYSDSEVRELTLTLLVRDGQVIA